MYFQIFILILSVIVAGLVSWMICASRFQREILNLKEENANLKSQVGLNENIINIVKAEFSKIAQDSLKNQQEQMISAHSTDLKTRLELFKSEEINPINKLLKDFKESIDNYQKSHNVESMEIKNAISIAEKYAKALTTNQNLKGQFGENQLEQILKFENLQENIHYIKQFSTSSGKPDFILNLPNNHRLIIDSKVILKNYLEYSKSNSIQDKKAFIADLTGCINDLAKRNYENIEPNSQAGFILMYIPIEACVSLIYTDFDFKNLIELANSKNIIIIGTASIIVTLRLVNQLWASKVRYDNIDNIIKTGEELYNNIAKHSHALIEIRNILESATGSIKTEINRLTTRNNGSIFKEAEKLKNYGIEAKSKTNKKTSETSIAKEFLIEDLKEEESI